MKITSPVCKALFSILAIASITNQLRAESTPDMRPALVGSDSRSLVNLINTQSLMKNGQGHAALFFGCLVRPNGSVAGRQVIGRSKESELLWYEVAHKLAQASFVPAVYNHRNVYAWFFGTVTFSVIDGKPHLRIFANQELPELQKESDFIAPQPIDIPGHIYNFRTVKDPFGSWATEDKPGMAEMSLTIDASGQIKDVHLLSVTPPEKQSYGESALQIMRERTFLPAYRNGKPVESTTHYKFYFVPWSYNLL
jgi:TonB-like protein